MMAYATCTETLTITGVVREWHLIGPGRNFVVVEVHAEDRGGDLVGISEIELEQIVLARDKVVAALAGRRPERVIHAGGGRLVNIVVKDSDVTNMINEMLKSRNLTMDQFKEMLAKDGLSLESYMEEAKDHLIRGRLANREIRSKIMVTDQEIGEYYKQHREEYEGREQVKLRQIVVLCPETAPIEKKREARAEIESIMARLKAGEKFEVLAAKYSPQLGGEMGFVEKGAMLQPVEDAAFKLKVGEVSDIVESPAGFHIIQLLDRRGAGIKSLQSVREEILNKLTIEKSEKKFEEWMTDLRKKSHIEIRL